MIDLARDSLPSALLVGGEAYEVRTSFRTWIAFARVLEAEGVFWTGVFARDVPESPEWRDAAVEFLASPNETPRRTGGDGPRTVDLLLDGDFIVAAFQQAYGIDLTEGDMHWHRFKALLNGLPEGTALSRIMGYRAYETPPKNADRDAEMRRLRRAWELPDPGAERAEREALAAFEAWSEG